MIPQYHRDIAVVWVNASSLGAVTPPAIPLARPDAAVDYRRIISVGCAEGGWATCWKGHAIGQDRSAGDVIYFAPAPADGRSGSAVFDWQGKSIVGLIAWRSPRGYGVAMTHREVWAALSGKGPVYGTGAMPGEHGAVQDVLAPIDPWAPGVWIQGAPLSEPCQQPGYDVLEIRPFGGLLCPLPRPQRPQEAPSQPPQGGAWPDLPKDLRPPGEADASGFATRSELQAAKRELQAAIDRLEKQLGEAGTQTRQEIDKVQSESQSQAAKQDKAIEQVSGAVQEQERTLRDRLRDVVTSDAVEQFRQELQADFLRRLKESQESGAGLAEGVKQSAVAAVTGRLEALKEQYGQGMGLVGVGLAAAFALLGISGTWQAWLITRVVKRLKSRIAGDDDVSLIAAALERIRERRSSSSSGS
jgi:hypothetical protein